MFLWQGDVLPAGPHVTALYLYCIRLHGVLLLAGLWKISHAIRSDTVCAVVLIILLITSISGQPLLCVFTLTFEVLPRVWRMIWHALQVPLIASLGHASIPSHQDCVLARMNVAVSCTQGFL